MLATQRTWRLGLRIVTFQLVQHNKARGDGSVSEEPTVKAWESEFRFLGMPVNNRQPGINAERWKQADILSLLFNTPAMVNEKTVSKKKKDCSSIAVPTYTPACTHVRA